MSAYENTKYGMNAWKSILNTFALGHRRVRSFVNEKTWNSPYVIWQCKTSNKGIQFPPTYLLQVKLLFARQFNTSCWWTVYYILSNEFLILYYFCSVSLILHFFLNVIIVGGFSRFSCDGGASSLYSGRSNRARGSNGGHVPLLLHGNRRVRWG